MIKIVAITLSCAFVVLYLKHIDSELSSLCLMCSEIIILFYAFSYLGQTVDLLEKLSEITGINSEYIKIIFKITSIGFIVEFGAGTVRDLGLDGLADKLVFFGKIIILCTSLPIIYSLIEIVTEFLN